MSETCIVFDVRGDFAHFRKPETTSPAQSFGLPPRTTVAGMVAAILGLPRDSYYDLFARDSSRIAVGLLKPVRREPFAINIVTTEGSGSKTKGAQPGRHITGPRQQNVFETLCDPAYRFYVSLNDDETMDTLESYVAAGKSHYALSLGLSEHLATTEYVGRYDVEETEGEAEIVSALPGTETGLIPEPGAKYVTERMPGFMRATSSGRQSDGFQTLTYERTGAPLTVRDMAYSVVGDEAVVFD